jgi:hypothetical protein
MSGHDHVLAQSTLIVHLPPNLSRQIANAHDHIRLQVWQSESAQHALLSMLCSKGKFKTRECHQAGAAAADNQCHLHA